MFGEGGTKTCTAGERSKKDAKCVPGALIFPHCLLKVPIVGKNGCPYSKCGFPVSP